MRRSEINQHLRKAEAFLQSHRFRLPPFASWSPDEWAGQGPEFDAIRRRGLGWDITDLGKGNFTKEGLILFTLRNGDPAATHGPWCYAEKIMVVGEGQLTPWHFHWVKAEDIINRAGGVLVVEVAWASEDESALTDREVTLHCDGIERTLAPGEAVRLNPGESISLPPKLYHKFYGEPGAGTVMVGEVSKTNDDRSDNRFLEPLGRFPKILEDEPPYRLLCNEYPSAQEPKGSGS